MYIKCTIYINTLSICFDMRYVKGENDKKTDTLKKSIHDMNYPRRIFYSAFSLQNLSDSLLLLSPWILLY